MTQSNSTQSDLTQSDSTQPTDRNTSEIKPLEYFHITHIDQVIAAGVILPSKAFAIS